MLVHNILLLYFNFLKKKREKNLNIYHNKSYTNNQIMRNKKVKYFKCRKNTFEF
jgi:hypothetical protein